MMSEGRNNRRGGRGRQVWEGHGWPAAKRLMRLRGILVWVSPGYAIQPNNFGTLLYRSVCLGNGHEVEAEAMEADEENAEANHYIGRRRRRGRKKVEMKW